MKDTLEIVNLIVDKVLTYKPGRKRKKQKTRKNLGVSRPYFFFGLYFKTVSTTFSNFMG